MRFLVISFFHTRLHFVSSEAHLLIIPSKTAIFGKHAPLSTIIKQAFPDALSIKRYNKKKQREEKKILSFFLLMFHFIVKNGSFSSDHRAPGLCAPKERKKERKKKQLRRLFTRNARKYEGIHASDFWASLHYCEEMSSCLVCCCSSWRVTKQPDLSLSYQFLVIDAHTTRDRGVTVLCHSLFLSHLFFLIPFGCRVIWRMGFQLLEFCSRGA